ncbi:hypothetical protein [Dapis sp. BLCC M126]|uniref:hypothetical protein n=1 Tax=Dapis sp. BLCC M126 TaxID=3400189 RepID=UPI003CEDA521
MIFASENYTKICNAVPPLLSKAFGSYIIKVLTEAEINPIPWDISSSNNHQHYREKVDSKTEDNNFPIQLKLPFKIRHFQKRGNRKYSFILDNYLDCFSLFPLHF